MVVALEVVVALAHGELQPPQAIRIAAAGLLKPGPGGLDRWSSGEVEQGVAQLQAGAQAAVALVEVGGGAGGHVEGATGGEGASEAQHGVALGHGEAGARLLVAQARQRQQLGPVATQPGLQIGQAPRHLQPLLLQLGALPVGQGQGLAEAEGLHGSLGQGRRSREG